MNNVRPLVVLLATLSALLCTTPAVAAPAAGLNVQGYTMNEEDPDPIPTWEELDQYTECPDGSDTWLPNIDNDWSDGSVVNCADDHLIVHYTGYITVPESGEYTFESYSDDGFVLTIDDVLLFEDWTTHPPQYNTGSISLVAGESYAIDAWFLEAGGGAVSQLTYTFGDVERDVIPAEWFTLEPYPLAETGFDPRFGLAVSAVVLLLGAGLVLTRRRAASPATTN